MRQKLIIQTVRGSGKIHVDQRVLELLAAKREAFDEYARRSDMASATPDAIAAGSESELGTAIVAAERARLKLA